MFPFFFCLCQKGLRVLKAASSPESPLQSHEISILIDTPCTFVSCPQYVLYRAIAAMLFRVVLQFHNSTLPGSCPPLYDDSDHVISVGVIATVVEDAVGSDYEALRITITILVVSTFNCKPIYKPGCQPESFFSGLTASCKATTMHICANDTRSRKAAAMFPNMTSLSQIHRYSRL